MPDAYDEFGRLIPDPNATGGGRAPNDQLDWMRRLYGPNANGTFGPQMDNSGQRSPGGAMPGGGPDYPAFSGQGPNMGYPASPGMGAPLTSGPPMPNAPPTPGSPVGGGGGFNFGSLLGINPVQAGGLPPNINAPGFAGAGKMGPNGQWTPGASINTTGTPRTITTPSTGGPQPITTSQGGQLIDPATGRPQPVPRSGQLTPYSVSGSAAPGIRTYGPGLLERLRGSSQSDIENSLNNPPSLSQAGNDLWTDITGHPWTRPATETEPQPSLAKPPPDALPPIGPRAPIPPFFRGPVPAVPLSGQRAPAVAGPGRINPASVNLGRGLPAPVAQQNPGEYFATTGNARTPTFQPGGFASPPAQHFQTPLTPMFGPGQWIGGQQAAQAPQPNRGGIPLSSSAFQGGGGIPPSATAQAPPQQGYNVNGIFNNLPNDAFGGGYSSGRGGRAAPAYAVRRPPIAGGLSGVGAGWPFGAGP